ncbi:zinc-binding dehydrogenase [Streptomyces sp. MAI_2237]
MPGAEATKLPYDRIVDSTDLHSALGEEKFDVVIDPVGGALRTQSLDVMIPGSRLIAAGNASDDWGHQVDTNQLWFRSITVSGYNAGAFLPAHPQVVPAALAAAVEVAAAGLANTDVEVLPFSQAVTAHQRMENRDLDGRIALTPEA